MLAGTSRGQTIQVVNMVPNAMSGETNQDSEPNVTVNPSNRLEVAGSAFTPDPLAGAFAPIFVSTDGGLTWAMNNIVPSQTMTSDITVRFATTGGVLYAGILRRPGSLRLNILRSPAFTGPAPMDVLVDRTSVDQPYVQAATVFGGPGTGADRVFVGHNDFAPTVAGRTATIELSLDAAASVPVFTPARVESRATVGQDLPATRPAVHLDGTIYGAFCGWRSGSVPSLVSDVVVVRDDNWGSGATPFTALVDPGDSSAGMRVATGQTIPFINSSQATFGQERFVASNLSIAVDPQNSSRVYVAWAEGPGPADYDLHVRTSTDRGLTWSGDLILVEQATNPALAVNSRGTVGFLYQRLDGTGASQRWVTTLDLTDNNFGAVDRRILANVPATAPAPTFIPYIGDYVHLLALGKDFYGIFSANNTPDTANFPSGVTFQRNANLVTHTLLNTDGTTPVAVSIDPFFFSVVDLPAEADFYVADWTESAVLRDNGLEPSTHPVFYKTSDVWNRRSNTPGGFNANNQPQSEDPQPSTLGDNFAFCRIRRNGTGSPATVTARFLVSEFGTGSNYQLAGAAPDLTPSFSAADDEVTLAAGYQWQLSATTSTHTCLAVEIFTATDPIAGNSLLGRAPGWPTTDLMVINDNNKAQRNMGVFTAGGAGGFANYAIVHNAATFTRDMRLGYQIDPHTRERLPSLEMRVVGGEGKVDERKGRIILPRMRPGENRWVELSYQTPRGKPGEILPIEVLEFKDNVPVNGFTFAPRIATTPEMITDSLQLHSAVFLRIADLPGGAPARKQAEAAAAALKDPGRRSYIKTINELLPDARAITLDLLKAGSDQFGLGQSLEHLERVAQSGSEDRTSAAHGTFLNRLDAHVSYVSKSAGDPADVLQTIRWHRDLFVSLRSRAPMRDDRQFLDAVDRMTAEVAALEAATGGPAEPGYEKFLASQRGVFESVPAAVAGEGYASLVKALFTKDHTARSRQGGHKAVLLVLDQTRHSDEQADQAVLKLKECDIVFRGTVKNPAGATVSSLKSSTNVAIVQVDEVAKGSESARLLAGREVTVALTQGPVEKGDQVWFGAASWLMADGVAVREQSRFTVQDGTVQTALRRLQELEMRELVDRAELIVLGKIVRIEEPPRERRERITEHAPEWRVAYVEVEQTLKGRARPELVPMWFATSMDVAWYKAPKPKVGDRAIWMLAPRLLEGTQQAPLTLVAPEQVVDAARIQELTGIISRAP